MRKENLPIDGEILRGLVKDTGLSLQDMSREMGMGDTYLSVSIKRNDISQPAAKFLERVYNIPFEAYRAGAKPAGVFNVDSIVEELKVLNGIMPELYDEVSDIRYVLNILAADLKRLKHELVTEEAEQDEE